MPIRYAAALAADTLTDIAGGDVAAGTYLLSVVNRTGGPVRLSVAVTSGGEPADADWIEYAAVIEPSGVLARHPLPLADGWRVYALAAAAGLSATLIGREE